MMMLDVAFDFPTKRSLELAKGESPALFHEAASLGSALDRGPIDCPLYGTERDYAVYSGREIRAVFDWVEGYLGEGQEHAFVQLRVDLERILEVARDGGHIRAWRGRDPFCECAFVCLCNYLRYIDCTFSVIELPGYYVSWGLMSPAKFQEFLPLERQVSAAERIAYSDLWLQLQEENAPIRAIINGQLMSVPEDFYDHLIIERIPRGEFTVSNLVSRIIRKYSIGIGDAWFLLRIKKMIDENQLEVVGEADIDTPTGFYRKILREVKE